MIYILYIMAGIAVGGVIAWLLATSRARSAFDKKLDESERRANTAEGKASALEGTIAELRTQNTRVAGDFEKLRTKLEEEQQARVKAETQLMETIQKLEEEKKLLKEAESKLTDAFKAIAGDTLDHSTTAFLKLAKPSTKSLRKLEATLANVKRLYKALSIPYPNPSNSLKSTSVPSRRTGRKLIQDLQNN